MIQRIQSVYLALVSICSLLLFMFPLYSLVPGETATDLAAYNFSIMQIDSVINGVSSLQLRFWPLIGFNAIVMILSIAAIFTFKNRSLQMKLSRIAFLMAVVLIVLIAFDTEQLRTTIGAAHILRFNWSSSLIIVQLIGLQLAYRAIKKDDNLVRSADRLR